MMKRMFLKLFKLVDQVRKARKAMLSRIGGDGLLIVVQLNNFCSLAVSRRDKGCAGVSSEFRSLAS